MKTDISKLPLKEWKHSLGVFLQMGRVQLDSDWNEQTETSLRLLQRQTEDVVGNGSPNFGFRVDDRILLSAMDSLTPWSVENDPNPVFYVDHFDFKVGEGSIALMGSVAGPLNLTHKLPAPRDLSQWKGIVVAAKFSGAVPVFFLGQGANVGNVTLTPDANTVDGWTILRGHPADAKVANPAIDLSKVDEYGFTLQGPGIKYQFDYVKADAPIRQVLVATDSPDVFTPTTANPGDIPQLSLNEIDRFGHSFVLEVTNVTAISYELPAVEDLSHVRQIIMAARTTAGPPPAVTFSLTDAANANVPLVVAPVPVGNWQVSWFPAPLGGIDLTKVKSVHWTGLTPATVYRFAPVLVESELQGNLVIMGGDGSADGAGRFYGDGLAAIKESNETYFSQKDLPEADASSMTPPAVGNTRMDLAYLDLWQRTITYIEDPDVREIALNGADTCTRKKLIAQVRILKGAEVQIGPTPPTLPDLSTVPEIGKGLLTTKDKSDVVVDPCADPCEPAIAGTFLGEDNRLFRVEIHRCGQIGAANANTTATFKWSRENGAVASAIIANAAAGDFSVKIEKPELFAVGDLIEIYNDLVDLVTGPYEDKPNHTCHPRGELRKISLISLDDRLISWQDAMSPEPQFHGALTQPERLVFHPGMRRWNDILSATPGDIPLSDGVVIEFGGSDMMPGDYWVFATRVIDRSVERLVEQPPHGIRHHHFPLARILRTNPLAGTPTLVAYDIRPRFDALTTLKATDVAFDASSCVQDDPTWSNVTNVQQALDAICRTELDVTIEDHNKHLHGSGVVCGLQLHCDTDDRNSVTLEKGYALDCDGHVIRVRAPMDFDVVTAAKNGGFLDNTGFGKVLVTMTRDMVQDAKLAVELSPQQTFFQKVLEGTLLEDFWVNCIQDVINFFKYEFLNPTTPLFPAKPVPVPSNPKLLTAPDNQKLFISVLNLFWQLLQPATGIYIFLSKHAGEDADDATDCPNWPGCPDVTKPQPPPVVSTSSEHHLLKGFYCCLRNLIASKTYCAEFDNLTQFPAYPYVNPLPGIDTVFGMFQPHTRIRLHPDPTKPLAYTCGGPAFPCNQIFVFDLNARQLINVLNFPAGTNIEVTDVAVSPDGTQLYAVGAMGQDSVFATAAIDTVNNNYTWGPTNMVCDVTFVTLGVSANPLHKTNLYAIGQSAVAGKQALNGLFIFTPPNFPQPANAAVQFNPTGMMNISDAKQDVAIVGRSSQPLGTISGNFDSCASISLAAPALGASFTCSGVDQENDIAFAGGNVYITATLGADKGLFQFPFAGGVNTGNVDLQTSSWVKLAPSTDGGTMYVSATDQHKVERVTISGNTLTLDTTFRIPVQILPVAMATAQTPNGPQLYVWNFLSFTLSLIDLNTVLAAKPNTYTAEPPATLSAYRTQMLNAFTDLFKTFGIYVKDCFCEQFLVNCPDCKDDKVYLGEVQIQDFKTFKICNFTKRRYVKSVQLMEYWLSTVPILPIIKTALADFCCKVI